MSCQFSVFSFQISDLRSQRSQGEDACKSPRKTNLTQRREDAKTQNLDWSVPVSSPACADFVHARFYERAARRTSSPARPSHHRGTLRMQPDSHRRISQTSANETPFDRSALSGRSPRPKGWREGRSACVPSQSPGLRCPRRGRRTPDTAKRKPFASLRLCAFAFLSYGLPTALCTPLRLCASAFLSSISLSSTRNISEALWL